MYIPQSLRKCEDVILDCERKLSQFSCQNIIVLK